MPSEIEGNRSVSGPAQASADLSPGAPCLSASMSQKHRETVSRSECTCDKRQAVGTRKQQAILVHERGLRARKKNVSAAKAQPMAAIIDRSARIAADTMSAAAIRSLERMGAAPDGLSSRARS
tara:strand:+ start:412 stop:780 length:369 start_codon:yes stop_codon:yes gene_type:complete